MKLNKALGLISAKYKEPSVCEACGGEFICGATITGCWCVGIKLSEDTRSELRKKYKACLCKDCLTKHESARPAS